MKIPFCLFLLISGFSVFAQTSDSTQVYFKGGSNKLEYSIIHYLFKHKGLIDDPDINRKFNRYFTVLLRLDVSAHLEDMAVFSVGDSSFTSDTVLTKLISAAVRETDGSWVNNTGQRQQVLIPVYYIYLQDRISDIRPLPTLPMGMTLYQNGKTEPFVSFKPLIVKLYPAMN